MYNDVSTSTADAPTPEALFATRIAGEVARQLYEDGQELRFCLVPDRERVHALLCDVDGLVLSRLSPSRVLEIATGEPVRGGWR